MCECLVQNSEGQNAGSTDTGLPTSCWRWAGRFFLWCLLTEERPWVELGFYCLFLPVVLSSYLFERQAHTCSTHPSPSGCLSAEQTPVTCVFLVKTHAHINNTYGWKTHEIVSVLNKIKFIMSELYNSSVYCCFEDKDFYCVNRFYLYNWNGPKILSSAFAE